VSASNSLANKAGPRLRAGQARRPAGVAPAGADRHVDGHGGSHARLGWRQVVDQTVGGLGYDLVDVERSARGLLRVFIDRRPGRTYPTGESEFVTVDDCEAVTRQLQYALEVDGVAYERLEVSSPGLDRPLKSEADYQRFAGQEVSLTLKLPFQGRKVWKGLLQRADAGWSLVFSDGKEEHVFGFSFDEVREARLVPVVDFKGRRKSTTGSAELPSPQTTGPAASPRLETTGGVPSTAPGNDGGLDR
jgi:ribosome maturation factor RimP